MQTRADVSFQSDGLSLRGWLYRPDAAQAGRVPIVVMSHGFSATAQGMVADDYAAAFAAAGLGVLLFDPRTIGRSDGAPRAQICSWWQARDLAAAVAYVRGEVGWIDPSRVALWGESFSANTALVAAAALGDIAAVAVQVPACGASLQGRIEGASRERFEGIRAVVLAAEIAGLRVERGPSLPVVSPDQLSMPSQLLPITAFHWFIQFGARFGTRWENRATRVSLETPEPFDAYACAPYLESPVLMVLAPGDEMPGANVAVASAVYERIAGPKERLEVDGGHFGLVYPDHPAFAAAIAGQVDFLVRTLRPAAAQSLD